MIFTEPVRKRVWFWTLFIAGLLVIVELAILIPLGIVLRSNDNSQVPVELNVQADRIISIINSTLEAFSFNLIRSSVALVHIPGRVSQKVFEDVLQLDVSPLKSVFQRYFWVPYVTLAEKDEFIAFSSANVRNGFRITQLNGSTVVPVSPRPLYAPFGLFVPFDAAVNNSVIVGFDALSNPTLSALLTNASLNLLTHVTLTQVSPNSFGLLFIARAGTTGYVMGLIDMESLLTFSLPIARSDIEFAAFDTSALTGQVLFLENTALYANITSVRMFNNLPFRKEFNVRTLQVAGKSLLIGFRFSSVYASSFAGIYWIIVLAILIPLFFCIDAVYVIMAIVLINRGKMRGIEHNQQQQTQLMLGYVNHEIRNPLQTILGLSDLTIESLQEIEGKSSEVERAISNLETIIRAAEFIEHIAGDILDLRKIEEGKISLDFATVDMKVLCSGITKAIQSKVAENPNVEFRIEIDPELPPFRSDRYRLEQVVMNFLTNAFKYATRGYVVLSFRRHENGVHIAVSDTGRGIPEEKKALLFQQFEQVSTADSSKFGGFGLGLYLCKLLAVLLHGEVGFESVEGVGSSFWIILPAEDVESIETQFVGSVISL
jgi:signal transduction histidine kinase